MPVWLLSPRRHLEGRIDNPCYLPGHRILHLPMFDGLLEEEGGGPELDVSFIFPSVARLGIRLSDNESASAFRDACELLRRTRGVIDPGVGAAC
jgi:hypothetical protein